MLDAWLTENATCPAPLPVQKHEVYPYRYGAAQHRCAVYLASALASHSGVHMHCIGSSPRQVLYAILAFPLYYRNGIFPEEWPGFASYTCSSSDQLNHHPQQYLWHVCCVLAPCQVQRQMVLWVGDQAKHIPQGRILRFPPQHHHETYLPMDA